MKNNIETIDYIELSEPKERYFITDIIFIIFLLFCLSAYIHYNKLELHNVENKERSFPT